MKSVEIPSSVRRLVKKQDALLDEGIRRIKSAKISKFDRMQFRRAFDKSPEQQLVIAEEIGQKILGPDYQTQVIKTSFGMLRQLAELGLQRYALFHQLIQPKTQEMILALSAKGFELLEDIINDSDLI